jgi:DUF2945 family protein
VCGTIAEAASIRFARFVGGTAVGMAEEKKLSKGDEVTWKSHGQTVHGTVEEKITSRKEAAGRTVDASKDKPQYRVKSDKSGKDAVHKPEALGNG